MLSTMSCRVIKSSSELPLLGEGWDLVKETGKTCPGSQIYRLPRGWGLCARLRTVSGLCPFIRTDYTNLTKAGSCDKLKLAVL